jgi:hypothetical protein
MSLKYALIHWLFHFLPVILFYSLLKFSSSQLFVMLLSVVIIDVDHLPRIRKLSWKKWLKESTNFHIPRKYCFHNFFSLFLFSILSLLILDQKYFLLGICSLLIGLHLLWDLLEDVFIFKMGYKHWKLI